MTNIVSLLELKLWATSVYYKEYYITGALKADFWFEGIEMFKMI